MWRSMHDVLMELSAEETEVAARTARAERRTGKLPRKPRERPPSQRRGRQTHPADIERLNRRRERLLRGDRPTDIARDEGVTLQAICEWARYNGVRRGSRSAA